MRCALFGRLAQAERVVQISAPAGSGKTLLLRSWIAEPGPARNTAWVPVDREMRHPRRFWIAVADALRGTAAGSALVRPLTPSPDLDGWTVVERLLTDLAALEDRLWLMIDDAHLLDPEVLPQLELLLLRAPAELRFVLATRHDLRLGLHRLRLAGDLTEIRAADLRFSLAEAGALFGAAGVEVPEETLARLLGRTEGWAVGLRLAALSLAGHPDPQRFAAEFSGTDRTVAEYLLAEVLDRQSEEVRLLLLLRTSVLERVSGPLADVLTGASGGERILQDLEQAGAFVVSLDGSRYGSATTSCSRTCCNWSCAAPSRMSRPRCTALLPSGWPGTAPGGGGPPGPGRRGLEAGHPAAVGPLARPLPRREGRYLGRAAGPVPPLGRRG